MVENDCSYFQTLLVTGGYAGDYLSSTEIFTLDTDNWRSAASLPSPRLWISAATLGNSLFVFGKIYYLALHNLRTHFTGGEWSGRTYDDILEYEGTSDTWRTAGKMKTPRYYHSVAPVDDISKFCP